MVKGKPPHIRSAAPESLFDCRFLGIGEAAKAPLPPVLDSRIAIAVDAGQFLFYLTSKELPALEYAMEHDYRLAVPKALLSRLRQYALIDEQGYPQSGITFCTHYTDDRQLVSQLSPVLAESGEDAILFPTGQLVLRTMVSLDGDLIHQVTDAHLRHPACLMISASHHWIAGQLMRQLRLSITSPIDTIVNVIPPVVVGSTVVANLGQMASSPGDALRWIGISGTSFLLPLARRELKAIVWRSLTAVPHSVTGKLVRWFMVRYLR
jgi:hypothetical protein